MPDISQINLPGDNNTYNIADLIARGRIWQGTQAQYNALTTIDPDTVYFITDATGTVLATVATTGSYNDLTDKPQIDTSLDTTSSNAIANAPVASFAQAISQSVSYKMDKENPTGTGSLSLNKASGSNLGTNAVALGTDNTASGNHSIALGQLNVASNQRAVALGQSNTVSGEAACALGYANTVSGDYSCVEGRQNIVTGKDGAHADGNHNKASYRAQHVFGEYNIEDVKAGAGVGDRGNYVEIVGKGSSDSSRSNARTLDWNGNEVLAGGLKVNGSNDVVQQVRFSIPKSSSKTVTVGQDFGIVSFLVSVTGNVGTLNHFLFFVSGYATASRCLVSTLVNTTGASQFTITATNTSNTIFTFNNLNATNAAQVSIIPLFNNTFTIT